MKIVSLDPGGTTGYAVFSRYNRGDKSEYSLTSAQIGPGDHHQALYDVLEFAHPNIVICEDFKYQRGAGGHNLTPVEYIGICKLWTSERNVPLELQPRAAKMLWNDEKIKTVNLWQAGKPHAMDAVRHMLYYVSLVLGDLFYVKQLAL